MIENKSKTYYNSISDFNAEHSKLLENNKDTNDAFRTIAHDPDTLKNNTNIFKSGKITNKLDKANKAISSMKKNANDAIDSDGFVVNNDKRNSAMNDTNEVSEALDNLENTARESMKLDPTSFNIIDSAIDMEDHTNDIIKHNLSIKEQKEKVQDNDYVKNGRLTAVGYAIFMDKERFNQLPKELQEAMKAAKENDTKEDNTKNFYAKDEGDMPLNDAVIDLYKRGNML